MEFTVIRDDITRVKADALILPANAGLVIESGVSKAVFDAAGRKFLTESCHKALKDARGRNEAGVRGLPEGSAVRTLAGELPDTFVIHTVIPSWKNGESGEEEALRAALTAALKQADLIGARSVVLPLLGAGSLAEAAICLYDTETCQRLKALGFTFPERIDEAYVLAHDETLPPPAVEVMSSAAKSAGAAGKALQKQAGETAGEIARRAKFMHSQARQASFDFQQHAAQAGRDAKFLANEASRAFHEAMKNPQTKEYAKQAAQIIGEAALGIAADQVLRKALGAASKIIRKKK